MKNALKLKESNYNRFCLTSEMHDIIDSIYKEWFAGIEKELLTTDKDLDSLSKYSIKCTIFTKNPDIVEILNHITNIDYIKNKIRFDMWMANIRTRDIHINFTKNGSNKIEALLEFRGAVDNYPSSKRFFRKLSMKIFGKYLF